MTGIYKITNKSNNKVYIGASGDIERRWHEHRTNKKSPIYFDFQKYGEDSFDFEVIIECPYDMLALWERDMIYLYDAVENGYNTFADIGSGLHLHTAEERMKMSKSHIGISRGPLSESTKQKISERTKGKSAWNKGICRNEETKRKISEALKGKSPWNKGIKHSEETRKRISEGLKRRVNNSKS